MQRWHYRQIAVGFLVVIVIGFSLGSSGDFGFAESRAIQSVTTLETSDASLVPTVLQVFEGPDGGAPPDTEIAVSDRAIVTAVNHKLNVFNKQDGLEDIQILFTTFFPQAGVTGRDPYDPHIEYDAYNKKFLIVVGAKELPGTDGYIGLIVGRTAYPSNQSDWCATKVYLPSENIEIFVDYPGMSINPITDLVFLTANVYDTQGTADRVDDTALGARVIKMKLSDVYSCPSFIPYKITPPTRLPNTVCGNAECFAESLHPAQWLDGFTSPNSYLMSHYLSTTGQGTSLYLWNLENTYASDREILLDEVSYAYEKAPGIRQINGQTLLMVNSPLISHAYQKNDTIYAVHDVKHPTAANAAVVIHQRPLDLSVLGTSLIRSHPTRDYAFQAMMLDQANHVAVGFSQTDTADPTINNAIMLSGITNDRIMVQESLANQQAAGGAPRGGDYSDAFLDPNGIDMWFINAYTGPNRGWRTKIMRVSFFSTRVFLPWTTR
ncbi:hypothetical protein Hgul01_04652 [Herpetosiphon gulosus]|uniref:Uncharacterized protein n=2 Tax=Herpetosiphon gulosus TaxID=1973496 RepID=A0ABP9X617_9CHLR